MAQIGRWFAVFTCLFVLSTSVIGCSSKDESRASSLSSSTDVCGARNALESSIDALAKVDVRAEGTNGLNAALDGVKESIGNLADAAQSQYKGQVQRVRDAYDKLHAAVSSFDASTASEDLNSISTAVSDLQTAVSDLAKSVTRC